MTGPVQAATEVHFTPLQSQRPTKPSQSFVKKVTELGSAIRPSAKARQAEHIAVTMAIMEGRPREAAVGQVQQVRWSLLPAASVATAPCLMGPWEYLLGAFICGVGWPGRSFICTQSSWTDVWPPPLLIWSPPDLPSPGEDTGAHCQP